MIVHDAQDHQIVTCMRYVILVIKENNKLSRCAGLQRHQKLKPQKAAYHPQSPTYSPTSYLVRSFPPPPRGPPRSPIPPGTMVNMVPSTEFKWYCIQNQFRFYVIFFFSFCVVGRARGNLEDIVRGFECRPSFNLNCL